MDVLTALGNSLSGKYEIEREIGRGGMATVYLARDRRHDRPVALKVFDPELGALLGAERFLAEIRVTANLQHPHLLPLFDSGAVPARHPDSESRAERGDGEGPSFLYYVMPYVAGETLRARLQREKQLPVDDAIRLTSAVASALDYAHRHGVIHRDLKPENILLHDGQPLVADFGIALALSRAAGARITQTGISLGTPHYMSPEQATGDRQVDGRTDIYSLGCVLYEMLTGEPPHPGGTAQAIIAKVLTETPRPVRVLRPTVPARVDAAIERALAKLPADRFATPQEFVAALEGRINPQPIDVAVVATAGPSRAPRANPWMQAAPWLLAGMLAGVAVWQWRGAAARSTPPDVTVRFPLDVDSMRLPGIARGIAFSPDGRFVAYIGVVGVRRALLVRPLDELRPRVLTDRAVQGLVISPDGNWVGYVNGPRLLKVAVAGGTPSEIANVGTQIYGVAWAPGNVIVLGTARGLVTVGATVSAGGSTPRVLTRVDTAGGERGQRWPLVLPDGKTLVYTSVGRPGAPEETRLGVASLTTGEFSVTDVPCLCPLGLIDDHLVIATPEGAVAAVPFDVRGRRVTGDPVVIADGLRSSIGGCIQAAMSSEGSFVFQSSAMRTSIVEMDARGTSRSVIDDPRGTVGNMRYAPDGRRIAIPLGTGAGTDIHIYELGSGTLRRLTTEGSSNDSPQWASGGKRVAFSSARGGDVGLWWQLADGSGPAEPLVRAGERTIGSGEVTRDGRAVVYTLDNPSAPTGGDIWWRRLDGDTTPQPLVVTQFSELNPRLSPDGRWVAYASNESGDYQVYVRRFPGPGSRYVVSNRRAMAPAWGPDERTLYYVTADGGTNELVAATFRTVPDFEVVSRTTVVQGQFRVAPPRTSYDVSPDGRRFLMPTAIGQDSLTVVHHWAAEVRARIAAGR